MMTSHQKMQVTLQVSIIRQGKQYIAYSPALDLSTSGKNIREAHGRFSELIDIFFEEIIEKNTIDVVLRDLGWVKIKKHWEPPQIISQKSLDVSVPVAV